MASFDMAMSIPAKTEKLFESITYKKSNPRFDLYPLLSP